MKKCAKGCLVAVASIFLAGIVYADGGWWGPGMNYDTSANPAAVRKFQKETSSLRDDLAAKYVELQQEMDKTDYDPARVAAIRKDIVDIEARIQIAARKHGVFTRPRAGATGSEMPRHGMGPGMQGQGMGCDCPWWGW